MPSRIPKKIAEYWDKWLPPILKKLRLEEHRLFLGLTIVIGLLAGLMAVLFRLAIDEVNALFFGGLEAPSLLRLIMIPTVVSIFTGFMLWKYFPEARGSGVPQTKTAYLLRDGYIQTRTPIGKFLMGALTIGAGHSMGREGPSAQIGAGLASILGRWFKLSPQSIKNLVPVGGAAAIGAAFNTPIAAVLFALEEIVGNLGGALLGSTVLASVAATVLARSLLGDEAMFDVPGYSMSHWTELLAFAALGVIGGFISVAFTKLLLRIRKLMFTLPDWSEPLRPAIGGLAIGLLAAFMAWQGLGSVMGVGHDSVDDALNGKLALTVLLVLGVAKFFATIFSYATGNAGGIFFPSLFIGAMLGGAMGTILQNSGVFESAVPGAYALVGMGTLFAGIIRAPMTSVFMIFELTQDYKIVLPLMIANMIAYTISRRFQRIPLYHALLVQDRIHIPMPGKTAVVGRWSVKDVMTHEPKTLSVTTTIAEALEQMKEWPGICFPVMREEKLTGVITRTALEKIAAAKDLPETTGADGEEGDGAAEKFDPATTPIEPLVMQEGWLHTHPDHPLETALERLRESPGILPVVSRSNTHELLGVISLENVMKTFTYKKSL